MSTGDHGEKPYELTRNPVDQSYGFVCREHGLHRYGLTHQHALNVERQHLRERHPDPMDVTLDVTVAARITLHYQGDHAIQALWMGLTGLEEWPDALELAEKLADGRRGGQSYQAAVVPL